ncbi:MAG: RNA 2',3'-cyclic phosphodiesterase, partial [Nitrosopumilus sp.]|nr:RNA 2',3'-cyclic phosphodiesterase [Nitrosopumilus sp.]
MRTFVAIEITNNEIINSVKKFQDSIKIDAKPVESNNFHFTLQFLGEITEEVSKKIIKALNLIEFTSFSV